MSLFHYKCIVIGLGWCTTAEIDVSDDDFWHPQFLFIQGLQNVWHIPNIQFVHIKIVTTSKITIKQVNTIAIAISWMTFKFWAMNWKIVLAIHCTKFLHQLWYFLLHYLVTKGLLCDTQIVWNVLAPFDMIIGCCREISEDVFMIGRL